MIDIFDAVTYEICANCHEDCGDVCKYEGYLTELRVKCEDVQKDAEWLIEVVKS